MSERVSVRVRVTMLAVEKDPVELLHWARDTLNGITALRARARSGEIKLSDEVHALLLQISADLQQIIMRNRDTDPTRWAR